MGLLKRTPRAPLEYTRTLWMRSWVGGVLVFLYAPLLVLMVFSFNDSRRNVVWRGFTTKYYEKALNNDTLVEALVNSLTIAFLSTLASLVIGAMAAIMLWRFRFRFKGVVDGVISLPIIVPEICLGVAMLIFFAWIEWPNNLIWPLNLGAITIAHITFSFPFVTMVVRSRLASFNRELEEAAKDLGVRTLGIDPASNIAEMAAAIRENRLCRLSPQYCLHNNEVVLAIHNAQETGAIYHVTTSFDPPEPMPWAQSV